MPRPLPPPKPKFGWRMLLRLVVWTGVLCGVAWGSLEMSSFMGDDPRFDLQCSATAPACPGLEIRGAVYADRARIQSVFEPDFGASVFHIPLAERRRHLLAIGWVRTAAVSRVWPSRIVVTITERSPVAFAKLPIGGGARYGFLLIDGDGVLLSIPPRARFRFPVLDGVTENETEAARAVHVNAMQRVLKDLGPRAKDISEVNASDPLEVRLITELDGHGVELLVGDRNYRTRYMNFLNHYGEIRKHSAEATVFDLRMDDRILAK